MKKDIFLITFVVLCLTSVIACQHKAATPIPEAPVSGGTDTNTAGGSNIDTGICFTRDILPIFISNCAKAGCHDAVTKSEGYQLTDYNSIVSKKFVPGNANATEIYKKITENDTKDIMPPLPATPLTAEQKGLIAKWINEGAKNTTNCSSPCDTNKFTYAAEIQPIMDKYCKGCHSGVSAPLGIVLDSYNGVVNAVNGGNILGAINHQPGFAAMPQGGNKLSACEIRKIEKWAESGLLNN